MTQNEKVNDTLGIKSSLAENEPPKRSSSESYENYKELFRSMLLDDHDALDLEDDNVEEDNNTEENNAAPRI